MKRPSIKTRRRITLSILLSVSLTGVLLLFHDKYHFSLLRSEYQNPNETIWYCDLDGDGNSEQFRFFDARMEEISIIVYADNKLIDQWNFRGSWEKHFRPFMGDYDHDGRKEAVVFSQIEDSLFLNAFDPLARKVEFRKKFVTHVNKIKKKYDFSVNPGFFYDEDGDGIDEIYFSVMCGHTKQPRAYFAYNTVKDTIYRSPESCIPVSAPTLLDMDEDGTPEIFSYADAYGNCDSTWSFSDMFCWLAVYTPQLRFCFPPLRLATYPSKMRLATIRNGSGGYNFLLAVFYQGTGKEQSYLALVRPDGTLIKKRPLSTTGLDPLTNLFSDSKGQWCYLLDMSGQVSRTDTSLQMTRISQLPPVSGPVYFSKLDVDGDGREVYIFTGRKRDGFIVTGPSFRHSVTVKVNHRIQGETFSLLKKKGQKPVLFLRTGDASYYFRHEKTLVYRYWYFLFLAGGLMFYLLLFLTEKIRHYRLLKVQESQNKIAELQLRSFKNHIQPHFTLNILQSFGHLIEERDRERAEFLFNNYTRMLKIVIINSDKVFVPLEEELDFVRSYLELESYRYDGRFEYRITVDDNVDEQQVIPKMLIHIFVENAVKHGLLHREQEKGGLLDISVSRRNGAYEIQIRDNGIGREAARKISSTLSTGKGIGIIDEILDLYNKLYRIHITHETLDLKENGHPAGTLVVIRIRNAR